MKTAVQWHAQWIWTGGEESPRNEWWCFRREFEVPADGWDGARLAVTADSRYVLYVNGEAVGRGPVRSWPAEQSYDTYDVSHLLRPGKVNTIGVLVLHFGVATFYYVRGRGGLLAQLDLTAGGEVVRSLGTDSSWRTARHGGQDERAPRMSCQQAFSERIDARLWDDGWTRPGFADRAWATAAVVGPVGTAPWTSVVPRDIPPLTEEVTWPVRVESLHRVRPPVWSVVVDVRSQMLPDSADHANNVEYVGYIATIIRVAAPTRMTLGFPSATATVFGPCSVGGVRYERDQFRGTLPERYLDLQLEAGDHWFLMDVTGRDHGHGLHMAIDSDGPFELAPPVTPADSPFIAIGPFDACVDIDHQPGRRASRDHEAYRAVAAVSSRAQLEPFARWVRPVPRRLVSQDDVFSLSVWKPEAEAEPVPATLQNAVIPNSVPAEVPLYPGRDTELIVDFGRELSGYLALEVEAPAGTVLDLYGFEYMRDGWRQDTYQLDNTLRYICRQGRQRYVSPVRRGLRYLMVTVRQAVDPVRLYGIQMVQSNFPVAEVGRFQCSDALLNDIWQISQHTTRLCMEDTFVDCPAYEQVFWVGDSRNEALVNYYAFGAEEIVRRCLRLVPGSRVQTPLYADQVPSGWSSVIPNWTFLWGIACYEYYRQTGDEGFAREVWPHVRFTLDHYLTHLDARGLLFIRGWNLLDWAPIDQPREGVVSHQNMMLTQVLRAAAQLAAVAGDAEGAAAYAEAAERLRAAINLHLWSEERQGYLDCIHVDGRRSEVFSMQTQIVAYLCGVPAGDRLAAIERYLLAPPGDWVRVGSPFMSFFYYEALARVKQFGFMLDDMRQNFGQMVEHGATNCWEMYPNFAENRANKNLLTRSHCHAWSAAPAYFLGAYVLGARNESVGWRRVTVEPNPCQLSWARGSVPLPGGGRVDISWRVEADGRTMHLQVRAPRHVEVSARLPEGYSGTVELYTAGRLVCQSVAAS